MAQLNWWNRACTLFLMCAATAIALCAQDSTPVFTTLHSFDGADGVAPNAALVQAADGNLYGTTYLGGVNADVNICPQGCGTVFKITPSGTLSTLYNFCSQANCTDGANPYSALVQATDGSLYGTTVNGGV